MKKNIFRQLYLVLYGCALFCGALTSAGEGPAGTSHAGGEPEANEEVEFFVVIPTYRNAAYCIENIESLCMQEYPYWCAAIIVDGGPEEDDGTHQILAQYIAEHELGDRIILQKNNRRCNSLANIDHAIRELCPSDDHVVVTLDGDDFFLHERALDRIAREYADPEVWLTYGQYLNMPSRLPGICHPFPEETIRLNQFRRHPFISSHPRTFYAWLYKEIRVEHLLHEGRFFKVAGDVAIMIPLLEMASLGHIRCISEPLYGYRHHPNNDYAVRYRKLVHAEKIIRQRPVYKPLTKRPDPKLNPKPHYSQLYCQPN